MGRERAGICMMNYEGYHDPTAGKAIRRAHRMKRRKTRLLTFKVGELPGFPVILK